MYNFFIKLEKLQNPRKRFFKNNAILPLFKLGKTPDKRANKKTYKPHYIGPNFVSPNEVTKKAKKKTNKKKNNQQQQ